MEKGGWISPTDLAKYDVVLCDYTVIGSEIYYSNTIGSGKYNTRTRKKITPVTPLTKLHWWRVVLDEAQMVETPTNKCSKMVKKLPGNATKGTTTLIHQIKFLYFSYSSMGRHWNSN